MTAPVITSVTAAEVKSEQVRWLSRLRIPAGELTIPGGAPGRGKTQYAIGLCAQATKGKLAGDYHGEPIDVAFVSCEDSISRTLVPRFLAADGDPARIHFFKVKAIDGDEDDRFSNCQGIRRSSAIGSNVRAQSCWCWTHSLP